MLVMRTPPDPARSPEEAALPPTYSNTETHWWDGSQIYGSNLERQLQVRSLQGGKLKVAAEALSSGDADHKPNPVDEPGFWLGLALMHNLFTLEHNAICDRLRAAYPQWSNDNELF